MKEYIRFCLQPFLLIMMLLVLMLLNTFATSLSLDLLYTMVGIAFLITFVQFLRKPKKSGAIVQIIYMVFFVYLAFSFLVVGGMVNNGVFAFVLYIVLLILDWIGLGYTAIQFKNMMKL